MSNIAVVGNASDTMIKFRLSLLKRLAHENKVYAICPDFSSVEKQILSSYGIIPVEIPFQRFGLNPVKELISIYHLVQFFLDKKIDISLCYFIKPVIYGTIAASISGVKRRVALIEGLGYFFTSSGKQTLKKKILKCVISILFKASLPRTHKVIFLNHDDEGEVEGIVGLKLPSVVLGGIGVDLKHLAYKPKISSSSLKFLLVARVLREKGILEYIQASKSFLNTGHEFWILGSLDTNPGGIKADELAALIQNSPVKWLGAVEDVKQHLEQCDIFVLPSYREGVPRSTQEAMAIGRAVITTDVQGCRETVVHKTNGLMIPAKSVKDLEDAFRFYIENPDMVTLHGRESRRLAEERFDSTRKDEFIYQLLLGK